MFRSLWARFFILLLAVSLVGLSASLYLRHMMMIDFRQYMEGEMLDKVYLVSANLEGGYEQWSGWNEREVRREAIRALMMGMVMRILDGSGETVTDTAEAVEGLAPLMKRRVLSLVDMNARTFTSDFMPYPLFLGGKRIGTLEVRFFTRERAGLFTERSIRFFLIALLTMGGLAVILSVAFSRKLAAPIRKLEEQARLISKGDFSRRVDRSEIDEIGHLSDSFNEMARNLELQESLRRKLIANVAHELRTPLGAMRGELEGMIDGLLPRDESQLRSLYEETGRLRNMLDGIDDLTQAQASSLTLEKQEIELKGFLGNLGERFRARAKEKEVDIKVDVGDGDRVWADPDRLSQILINLLENAIRATSTEGTVTLQTGVEKARTFIEVADTGSGIDEKDLPLIFERFYSGQGGGLGLGLSIVRELVEAHGGEIEVHSEKGEGTRVKVILPSGPY